MKEDDAMAGYKGYDNPDIDWYEERLIEENNKEGE